MFFKHKCIYWTLAFCIKLFGFQHIDEGLLIYLLILIVLES